MADINNPTEKTLDAATAQTHAAAGDKVAKHKKTIMGIIVAVLVVAFAGLGWWWYTKSTNKKSADAFANAYVNGMKKGGEEAMIKEFENVAKTESGKVGGTQANIELAGIYLSKNEYQKALNAIQATDIKEPIMKMSATLLEGDCYVGLKKYDEALRLYGEVFDEAKDNNSELAVRALMKKASVLEAQKKSSDALAVYEQIQKDYPDALEQADQYVGTNPDMTPLTDEDIEAAVENQRAGTGK